MLLAEIASLCILHDFPSSINGGVLCFQVFAIAKLFYALAVKILLALLSCKGFSYLCTYNEVVFLGKWSYGMDKLRFSLKMVDYTPEPNKENIVA